MKGNMERFSEEYLKEHFRKKNERKENNKDLIEKKQIQTAPVRKKSKRAEYYKNYHKAKNGFEEPKIKDINQYLEYMGKLTIYPDHFPVNEFSKSLDILLKEKPKEISEKTLKDKIYDIMDAKGLLTPIRIINIYQDKLWGNSIENIMKERDYIKNGDEKYVQNYSK